MAQFKNKPKNGANIILFDGVCGLCDRLVQFVLKEDKKGRFMYASLQSDFARDVLSAYNKDTDKLSTFYAIAGYGTKKERLLQQSDAAIFVLVELGGAKRLAALLMTVPVTWRDAIYNFIARHRYRIFGRYDQCIVPNESYNKRFIEL